LLRNSCAVKNKESANMAEATPRHPITLQRFLRHIEGMERVETRRDVPYLTSGDVTQGMDIYYPAAMPDSGAPVVLVAAGYRDVGVPLTLGCRFKEMELAISLAQLIAASGMAAVVYETSDPATDVRRVVDVVVTSGRTWRLDANRIGIWGMSGHGPTALALLMDRGSNLRAAVLSTAYTMDLQGSAVADAAATYRFVDAAAGRSLRELPKEVPLLLVRAGKEQFHGLNEALDRFVAAAIEENLPVTLINHATAPHAFELSDDSSASRYVIDTMLQFMRFHLGQ
jgi:dienelactone hydrolase